MRLALVSKTCERLSSHAHLNEEEVGGAPAGERTGQEEVVVVSLSSGFW